MNKRKKDKKKNKDYKDEINCLKCKAKFGIWLVNSNFPEDIEERVRKRFYQHCGICRSSEQPKKGRSKEA